MIQDENSEKAKRIPNNAVFARSKFILLLFCQGCIFALSKKTSAVKNIIT